MTANDFYRASKSQLEDEFKRLKSWAQGESVNCVFHEKTYAIFLVVIEEKEEDKSWLDTMVFSVHCTMSGEWEIKQMKAEK